MTQLIGAISEGHKKVVLLSDRLISRGGLGFERGSKGVKIAENAMVLFTGTAQEPELIEEVRSYLQGQESPTLSVFRIAKTLAEKYQQFRLARIDELLKAIGFNSIAEYHQKQKELHDASVREINSAIERYNLNVSFLLGGIDSLAAHLYCIDNPGKRTCFDAIGFHCPGVGREQAEFTFMWYEFTPDLSERETLYIAFEAKKRAEIVGQVGKATDAWLIDEGGIYEISGETIEELDRIYSSRQALHRLGKEVTELRILRQKMGDPNCNSG